MAEARGLVGGGLGGLVALTLARTRPELVLSLALFDPVAFGVLFDPADAEGLADLPSPERARVLFDDTYRGDEAWLEAFVDYWNGAGSWRALPAPSRDAFRASGRKMFLEVRSLSEDRTPLVAYEALGMPTLLMHGEHTPTAARRVVTLLGETMPDAKVECVVGAGHMAPISHADVVNAHVARHLRALQRP